MDTTQQQALAEQLAKLRAAYLVRLPVELAALQALAGALQGGEGDRASLEALHQRLHKLAGSGGTFGLAALSAAARALEQRVMAWLAGALDAVDAAACRAFATELGALVQLAVPGAHAEGEKETGERTAPAAVGPVAHPLRAPGTAISVWVMEDDAALGQQLVRQLESFNYRVRLFTRIDEAERAAQSERADMLIMDVMFEAEGRNATEALADSPALRALGCPLLFITSTDDFDSRVRAARLGAVGYFLKPIDIPRLVNRMGQLLEQLSAPPQRVLVVDDDADLADHLCLVLRAAGMVAEVLRQPETIMEALAGFQPDLVLMDMHMPRYTGPELAGVIRQHDKWTGLPIVYLSAETDLARQIAAMRRGGDDFIIKPVSDAQLVAAVRVRVERARQLADQINKDSLTGLLKHASIKEVACKEIRRARRTGKPVTLAMFDIDHFKSVNDTYGHATGDLVIAALATLLRQRLRQSDHLGRYGGEEFLVVLPECSGADAQRLLDDIRRRFASLRFSHEGQNFSCSISAGHASSRPAGPGDDDEAGAAASDAELLSAADAALYDAKRGGRNRVCAAAGLTARQAAR
ncbi:diguanylate cyclase [Thauera sp. JM12B12]|uniref:GGDEF domain-containing response regulator n=1 Tax=Thauera sp. JM12B12 TaxID=3142262 RepID=UPI0031F3EF7D